MPLAGTGMLLTSMNIDAADEADFNRWYDREHLEERVAIEGFLEARRYVAHAANPKYLSLYSTATLDVLDSPAYRARLANQTEWSRRTMAQFKNMLRVVARVTISKGSGRGAVLGLVRLRPRPTTRAHGVMHCKKSWRHRIATASSRCTCSRASPNCPERRLTFRPCATKARATGSC
ncbi:hypothetical protein SAMN05216525_13812 [Bradyrhizobium sp. Gha]|nr:hypothetical protein SAMN05216525_13812 [Bradyrhizobium sp. Gha]